MNTGDRIKRLRLALDMTLEDVAAVVGVTRQTVQKYESGIVLNIPPDKIELLAQALHSTPAYLMGWDPNSQFDDNLQQTLDTMAELRITRDPEQRAELERTLAILEESSEDIAVAQRLQEIAKEMAKTPAPGSDGRTSRFEPISDLDRILLASDSFAPISEFYNLSEEGQKEALKDIQDFIEFIVEKYKRQENSTK